MPGDGKRDPARNAGQEGMRGWGDWVNTAKRSFKVGEPTDHPGQARAADIEPALQSAIPVEQSLWITAPKRRR